MIPTHENPMLVPRQRSGQRKNQSFMIRAYMVLVIWALLLTPSLPTPAGIPSIRFDDVLLILAPMFVALIYSRVFLDRRVLFIFLIAASIEFGIFTGAILGYPASLLDHFVWLRLAKYAGAIILTSALFNSGMKSHDSLKWLVRKTIFPGFLLILVVIQQYFNIGGLNEYYVQFVAPTQYETLVGGYPWPRPVGMIGNPNELSFLLGILSLAAIWMAFQKGEQSWCWMLAGLIFFATAGSTLSRSGLFATSGALVVLNGARVFSGIVFRRSGLGLRKKVIVSSLIAFGVIGCIIAATYLNDALYEQITWRFMPENTFDSLYKRLESWRENIQLWLSSPVFGVGLLKHSDFLKYAADNEWLLLLRSGGIILVGMVGELFLVGLFRNDVNLHCKQFSGSLIFGAVLYMIPAAFFYSLVIMPLSLMLLTAATPSPWMSLKVPTSSANSEQAARNFVYGGTRK